MGQQLSTLPALTHVRTYGSHNERKKRNGKRNLDGSLLCLSFETASVVNTDLSWLEQMETTCRMGRSSIQSRPHQDEHLSRCSKDVLVSNTVELTMWFVSSQVIGSVTDLESSCDVFCLQELGRLHIPRVVAVDSRSGPRPVAGPFNVLPRTISRKNSSCKEL